jgi:hypothetical protein
MELCEVTPFEEIERFNVFASANPTLLTEMLEQSPGMQGLVDAANRCGFDFSAQDVRKFIELKTATIGALPLRLSPIAGCTYSVTSTCLATQTLVFTTAVTEIDVVAEGVGGIVAVIVAVLVVVV